MRCHRGRRGGETAALALPSAPGGTPGCEAPAGCAGDCARGSAAVWSLPLAQLPPAERAWLSLGALMGEGPKARRLDRTATLWPAKAAMYGRSSSMLRSRLRSSCWKPRALVNSCRASLPCNVAASVAEAFGTATQTPCYWPDPRQSPGICRSACNAGRKLEQLTAPLGPPPPPRTELQLPSPKTCTASSCSWPLRGILL
jgi:hypothetical protein